MEKRTHCAVGVMKVILLAGGVGSRLLDETLHKPKALVQIGDKPIIWHIMKHYADYGFKNFIIALGYKGEMLKQHLPKYCYDKWNVSYVDTGEQTATAGRIKLLRNHIGNKTFMLACADGVSNINFQQLVDFHKSHHKLVTLTAVSPPERFGCLHLQGNRVIKFEEKPAITDRWINGAFSVIEPPAIDYIEDVTAPWEKQPLEKLVEDNQVMAYYHKSFWQCMDTPHEKKMLQELWDKGAPWKIS